MIRLVPPQAATVVERHVTEGQVVKRGDVLFVLSMERATLRGDTQAAVQASLAAREKSLKQSTEHQQRLQQSQAVALQRQIADMQQELAQIGAEAALQAQRLALAQQAQARLESLRNDNFVSSAQVQAKAEEVLGLRAQLQSLERQRAVQQREIGNLEAQARELPLRMQAQQGELERDLAVVAQRSAESEAQSRLVVRAPEDGMVTAVVAERGQPVTPGVALASLLPADARLQAHLFAPSSAVGFLHSHQPVQLRYQAYPYQKFGHHAGEVLQVSRTPLQAAELAGLSLPARAADEREPLYRITVSLDQQAVQAYGRAQPLAPGMQLDADVLLDRRRLIEWIFEPLLSVTGRV
ncbi:HlyD family secretion protein [Piscinibacter gummiphilus]|uniref:HlyD family efflux transporter periplasmic adaptor subunit n=1 Tax=Piscinibacter gummiphilus TaxID=946333 RepID=A0ABZ0CTL7_9BURK|nr:HlyD family efflux transporter periplasmic adaptor subunit [Piscinibacter gummiphilus]WOB08328.1 HlyD family efflux transporter periplasmic adaptor subunit [Piscinibacter gummiphilus]